jgi:hypothetical protein
MPWVAATSVGPVRPAGYAIPLLVIALPNLFVTGAIFFTIATLSRSLLATYLAALAFFIAYIVLQVLLSNPKYRTIAGLADPFGGLALMTDTAYWSNAERNTRLIPLNGLLMWNRLLWIGIGLAAIALSLVLQGTGERAPKSRGLDLARAAVSPAMRERPILVSGGAGIVDQLVMRARFEIGSILRSWTFLVLLLLVIAACIGSLVIRDQMASAPELPVTSVVVDIVAAAFAFAAILVPLGYAGELIWRDRKYKIASIIDAAPAPTAVFLLSKIAALVVAVLLLLVAAMASGVGYQLVSGFTDIDFGVYVLKLFAFIGVPAIAFGILALLVQTLVNQKFVGLLIVLAVIIAIPNAASVGIENPLLLLFDVPDFVPSEMNGYGHFAARMLWFSVYWTCVAVLVAVATQILWVRGTGSLWTRIKTASHAVSPAVVMVAGVALAGTAASAGYIYWNTHVRNEFVSTSAGERIQVAYEKTYRSAEKAPQPRITDIDLEVDLYPEQRGYRSRGRYLLQNRTDTPIDKVHVIATTDDAEITLQDAELAERQKRFGVFEFRPRSPIMPGETRTLSFVLSDSKPGFQAGADVTPVVYNGSFVHSQHLAPLIGVQRALYLQSTTRRRAHGLEPLPEIAKLGDKDAQRQNLFSTDSDFIRFAITVSTSADQIALAPGDLEREWTEGNRRFFRYRLGQPTINFWSVVSGRYAVARDKWNDIEVAVYHHPQHATNVPRMLDGMKAALAYYSAEFGPFPHRQLRIVEYPRYASFAQSFPTMVPYSEAIGFVLDLRNPETLDEVWHVSAHETAHQWWGHQIAPAAVEGAQFLSESISEYSALMVAEHRYGAHKMRQYLKRELDVYLSARGNYTNERTLARAITDQFAVHYKKGSLTFYALKDMIGEATLNAALARFLREKSYKSDPYPTSADLLAVLRAEAGPAHDQLITDLFERITLWDLAITGSEATATGDGKWRVRVDVRAKKLDSTGDGRETEVPLDQAIDIGLFAADPDKREFTERDVIALEKHQIKSGSQSVEFTVDRKPTFVGVDPYVKLISRDTAGNLAPLGRKAGS